MPSSTRKTSADGPARRVQVKYFDSAARLRAWLRRRHHDDTAQIASVQRVSEIALRCGLVLAVMLGSACVQPTPAAVGAGGCDAAATVGERSLCTLAEAQALEARLEVEEARTLLALERFEAGNPGETGTGRSLAEEFRRSQQAWREYQDAECSYAYATALGGSLRGLNAATCLRELLQQRIERVRSAHDALAALPRPDGSDTP